MKISTCLVPILCLGAVAALPAQILFSDSLATGTNWIVNPANVGGGSLVFSSSRLNYDVITPDGGGTDNGFQQLNSFAAPSTLSWSAQVEIHLASLALANGQFTNLNLMVAKASDAFNNNAMFSLDRYNAGSGVELDIDAYITVAGGQTHLTPVFNATTDATLMISYNHLTAELIYSYDADGAVGGPNFVTAHTQSIAGWSMTGADNFAFLMVGASGFMGVGVGPAISPGEGYFQNFAVTAIPEPSTYAAIVGACALGLVVLRRRIRSRN
jgi:hypothetical protein